MKINTTKEELLKGIQTVQNAVSNKNTLPILSHILLEVKKGGIYLTATDLEIGVSMKVPGEIIEEGAITIPARKFSEIVKELPSQQPIYIAVKKANSINIESGKSFFRLMGLSKDDFPQLPDLQSLNPKESLDGKNPAEEFKKYDSINFFCDESRRDAVCA